MEKPDLTKTTHILPFGELSPLQFERMCLWLIKREGYLRPEHLGEAGSEQGRDVIAYRRSESGEEELWYLQCKRYQTIGAPTLIKEVEKYNELVSSDPAKRPVGIVFVTNAVLSAAARETVQKFCTEHGYKVEFWARTELDMLVKKHPEIVSEFFNLTLTPEQAGPQLSQPPGTRIHDRKLRYGYGVEFVGRSKELSELREFANSNTDFSWWLWTAPGGQGKTRLAAQLCLELLKEGWRCGFLPATSDFAGWQQWIVNQPTLVVIDHVARRPKKIRDAITAISRAHSNVRAPLRFLLLERPFDAQDEWLREFVPESSEEDKADLFEHLYLVSGNESYGDLKANARRLERLNENDLWQLITTVSEELETSIPDRESTFVLLGKIDPLLRPLFVIFSLYAIAAKGWDGVRRWNRDELVRFILKREFDLWQTTLLGDSEDRDCFEQHVNLVTFATIAGRQRKDLSQLLREYAVPSPTRQLPDWLRVITGYAGEFDIDTVAPVEPDLLGELFVLERLAGEFGVDSNRDVPKTTTKRILDIAFAREHWQTIDFIKRCVNDFAEHPSIETFAHIQIPEGDQANYAYFVDHTVHLGLVASIFESVQRIDLAEQCFDQLVQRARGFSSSNVSRSEYQTRLAKMLYNRALLRSKLGRLAAALPDCNEVISLVDVEQPRDDLTGYQQRDLLWHALMIRADIYGKTGQRDKAEEDLKRVLESADVNMRAEALLFRAEMRAASDDLRRFGDYEEVLALNGHRLEEVKSIATWKAFKLAYSYYEHDLALEYFDRLVRMTEHVPERNAMARVDRGNIHLRMNNEEGAEEDWSSVARDSNSPIDQRRKALLNRGQLLLRRGALTWALADIDTALKDTEVATRDHALGLLTRAQINHFLGKSNDALADISSLINDPLVDRDIQTAAEQLRSRYSS